jgi:hypothetical protein
MRVATIRIKGLTPYSQSRALQSEKNREETHDDFDKRIWREHLHVNSAEKYYIPAVAITQGLADAASYLGKGGDLKKKGNATWAENFRCGLAIAQGPVLNASEPRPERVYCHADGKRGSGKRVWRTFPVFDAWQATLVIHILDDSIPEEIFEKVVNAYGLFIGVGRFRPQNNGYLGRFVVENMKIEKA